MTCDACFRDLNSYSPACLGCGGRYLRDIQRRRMGEDEKRTWLRKVLADWMAFGHAEAELRAAAKPKGKRDAAA